MHSDMDSRLAALEARLGVTFKNRDLLLQAVTHRSYLNEHRDFPLDHNERLEFLGDAVLEMAITEFLYRKYQRPEGVLTSWRAALVNAESLAGVSHDLGVEQCLLLSRGECKEVQSKARHYILADAFEAILGAVYLDQGFGSCRLIVDALLLARLTEMIATFRDTKSELQEMTQERFGLTPCYEVAAELGPAHKKEFRIDVCLDGVRLAQGSGGSKHEAQKEAANIALQTIHTWEGRLKERERSLKRPSRKGGSS